MNRIGVAISGGGHRAGLFGLGVLMYLADAGKNGDVVTLSSVSGGSITNAQVGLQCDFRATAGNQFIPTANALASQIAKRGTLWAWWGSWVYLAATVLAALLILSIWCLPCHWLCKLLLFLAAAALWDLLAWRKRGDVCARAYAATALKTSGGRARLSALAERPIDHILCSTHLNAGEHMYLSGRFAYAYRFGWDVPGQYPLDQAVQASTALPGAFPPRWLPTRDFGFSGKDLPRAIPLADGGVYDNMADQWFKGIARRAKRANTSLQIPNEVVLVNASASMQMSPVRNFRLPFVGRLLALLRDVDIMYDNSASLRKSGLIARFDLAAARPPEDRGTAMSGALIDIGSSPYTAPLFFQNNKEWPERATRATEALEVLKDMSEQQWKDEAQFSASVPTTLSKLGVDRSARVLRHAYALASTNLHVILGYPLRPLPPLDYFRSICE